MRRDAGTHRESPHPYASSGSRAKRVRNREIRNRVRSNPFGLGEQYPIPLGLNGTPAADAGQHLVRLGELRGRRGVSEARIEAEAILDSSEYRSPIARCSGS